MMTERAQKVVHMLRRNPTLSMTEVARRCHVSLPYVSKLNAELAIRPAGHKGNHLTFNQFVDMARKDLRDSADTYETACDKRMLLESYIEAARRELAELKPEAAE